jgi:hypothetical protein
MIQHVDFSRNYELGEDMVPHVLELNSLRILRLEWKDTNIQEISPEDLLCKTFAALTNCKGLEGMFKLGLCNLDRGISMFQDEEMTIRISQ